MGIAHEMEDAEAQADATAALAAATAATSAAATAAAAAATAASEAAAALAAASAASTAASSAASTAASAASSAATALSTATSAASSASAAGTTAASAASAAASAASAASSAQADATSALAAASAASTAASTASAAAATAASAAGAAQTDATSALANAATAASAAGAAQTDATSALANAATVAGDLSTHTGSTDGHPAATAIAPGLMTAAQFSKLFGITAGAQPNVNVFGDDVFRAQAAGDATKQIALDASAITTGTTRTITMPDADVDLGAIGGGGGGVPATTALAGFSAANYYSAASGELAGNALGFSLSTVIGLAGQPAAFPYETIMCAHVLYAGTGGWRQQASIAQFFAMGAQDSDGAGIQNYTQPLLPGTSTGFDDTNGDTVYIRFPQSRLCLELYVLTQVFTLTQMLMYLNGELVYEATLAGGYRPAVGIAPRIGLDQGGSDPGTNIHFCGAAYGESILTQAEVVAHARACHRAQTMVEGAAGWDNLWTMGESLVVPATLEDTIGSVDFTLTGSLSVVGL